MTKKVALQNSPTTSTWFVQVIYMMKKLNMACTGYILHEKVGPGLLLQHVNGLYRLYT
jgi:hypothetical protein